MFEIENFSYIRFIHPFEWVMLGIYCIVIFAITFGLQVFRIQKNPVYRYYTWGVFMKVMSSVVFCLIYIYYYNGGDTVSYYETSRALVNLALKDIGSCFDVVTSTPSLSGYMTFDRETGYPWPYMYFDSQSFFMAKTLAPLLFLSGKSYLVGSVMLSWFSFFGVWQFYLTLCRHFPGMEKRIAYGILFVPSVLFWGSGILKDTITFSAVCWFIVGMDNILTSRGGRIKNGLIVLAALYALLSVKPYVLYSLLPGTVIWAVTVWVKRIESKFVKVTMIPMAVVVALIMGYLGLSVLGGKMGKFSVEKMLETASITQKDLKQDYYQGSSFDIGDFDPTVGGMLSKVPIAMRVGLFQPFVWEARNVVMIFSGLENLIYLLIAVFLVFKILRNPRRLFRILNRHPILILLLLYTLLFSVMVGLSTSNFGALVRFKIAFMSCYVVLLLILHGFLSRQGEKERREEFRPLRKSLSKYPQGSAGSVVH
jgi:hypothetical protein